MFSENVKSRHAELFMSSTFNFYLKCKKLQLSLLRSLLLEQEEHICLARDHQTQIMIYSAVFVYLVLF